MCELVETKFKTLKCAKDCSCKLKKVTKLKKRNYKEDQVFSQMIKRKDVIKEDGETVSIPPNTMFCFEPIASCAEKITDMTLLLAKCFLTGKEPEEQIEYEKIRSKPSIWPKSGELSIVSGLAAIEKYLDTMDIDPTLKYCVNFISQRVDWISTSFIYEVKWSIPTNDEPVQLATANVYFSLKSYYSHLKDCPVDVTYVYENSNILYTPGEVKFKDSWLLSIMQAKTEMRLDNNFQMDTFI